MEKVLVLIVLVGGTCVGSLGIACLVKGEAHIGACEVPQFLQGINASAEPGELSPRVGFGASLVTIFLAGCLPALFVLLRTGRSQGQGERDYDFASLYLQRFLSAWGDRMWQFAVPVIFIDLFRDTLLPTSLYVMIVYIVVIQFLPSLGSWIDKADRLQVQQICLKIENVCVVFASFIICLVTSTSTTFKSEGQFFLSDWETIAWFVVLILLGSVGELFNNTLVVSMDKDWVVVIAEQAQVPVQRINAWMRRIDLACKALSPAAFAALYQTYGPSPPVRVFYGSLTVGIWNLLSFPLEVALVRRVYNNFPDLSFKSHLHSDGTQHSHQLGQKPHFHIGHSGQHDPVQLHEKLIILPEAVVDESEQLIDLAKCVYSSKSEISSKIGQEPGSSSATRSAVEGTSSPSFNDDLPELALEDAMQQVIQMYTLVEGGQSVEQGAQCARLADGFELIGCPGRLAKGGGIVRDFISGFRTYWAQPVFLASFAYTMLYMTVLDTGGLQTSYLEWAGVPTAYIGIGRGAGAVIGLAGTFAYPLTTKCLSNSVAKAGLLSLWAFWLTLAPIGLLLIFTGAGENYVEYSILICVSLSRCFLWMFDLAITELVQMGVPEEDRGVFGSIQTSSYQVFFILVHLAGVFSPDPANFHWLIVISLLVVLIAAVLYTYWFIRHDTAGNNPT